MVDKFTKQRATQKFIDEISELTGPIYGVRLLESLPLRGGMIQAMPSRDDLVQVKRISERTVAGFEVLTAHYRDKCGEVERLKQLIRNVIAGHWTVTGLQEAIGEI